MTIKDHLIDIYIPSYNCKNQITKVLEKIFPHKELFNNIFIIDNCSTDGTVDNARTKQQIYGDKLNILINDKNLGFGGSHKIIFDNVLKKDIGYVLVLHGDDQANINDIIPYIKNREYIKNNALLGSRFMYDSKLINYSFPRRIGNIFFNILYSIVLRKKISDLGSGINLYSKKCFKDLEYKKFNNDLTFNYQNTINIFKNLNNLKFFPISWREEDQISNVRIIKQTLTIFNILIKYLFIRKI
jgi:glycosyltransferase involved in cell wall biosynthesis